MSRRGFYGSLISTGSVFGSVAGNAVFLLLKTVLTGAQFDSWGWRVPFWIGIVLVVAGIYVQLKVEDTPVFKAMRAALEAPEQAAEIRKAPLVDAIRTHWREILQAAGAATATNVVFYVLISGMLDYATSHAHMSSTTALVCVLIAGSTEVIAMPLFGALSDRVGRRRVYLTGAILMGVFAFPLFWLVNTGSVALSLVALIVAFTIHAIMYGSQAAIFAEMFPADIRFSGVSLGFQIASVLAGGFAPFIMTALLIATGASWSVSLYIIAACVITFISAFKIRDSFSRDLSAPSATARIPMTTDS